jgi:hypothetical protein
LRKKSQSEKEWDEINAFDRKAQLAWIKKYYSITPRRRPKMNLHDKIWKEIADILDSPKGKILFISVPPHMPKEDIECPFCKKGIHTSIVWKEAP